MFGARDSSLTRTTVARRWMKFCQGTSPRRTTQIKKRRFCTKGWVRSAVWEKDQLFSTTGSDNISAATFKEQLSVFILLELSIVDTINQIPLKSCLSLEAGAYFFFYSFIALSTPVFCANLPPSHSWMVEFLKTLCLNTFVFVYFPAADPHCQFQKHPSASR